MSEPTSTRVFAPFEWMLSLRYLRARRKEGFISVIAGFSFLGIMLGQALSDDGVKLAIPIVESQALASSPFSTTGVLVRGIRAADLMKLSPIAKNIKQGSLEGFDDSQGLVIGRRLAGQLSLRAGDNITLVAPRGAAPLGTTPRIKIYKVAAVFESGMSEYDAALVFMPLKEAQAFFDHTRPPL